MSRGCPGFRHQGGSAGALNVTPAASRQILSGPGQTGASTGYFIHLLLGVKSRDALVRSTIWIQRI
jgi:hypothetical protein